MTKLTQGLGLVVGGTALATGIAMYGGQGGSGARDESYRLELSAAPRTLDEGDLVEFVANVSILEHAAASPGTGATGSPRDVEFTWDFDDGSQTATGLDLQSMAHRFADDRDEPYVVRARVGTTEQSIDVHVRNVAPSIRNVWRSRPATPGDPVDFEVSAVDPGVDDTLVYTWSFGDGGSATGARVSHTFGSAGMYDVTVTANDGDGGEDTATLEVAVGEVGSFTVSGDIALPEVEVERAVILGTAGNPFGARGTAPCALRIDMGQALGDVAMTLTANLVPGLGERRYRIGTTADWDGMHVDEAGSPGVFFANLSLPPRYANRNFNGQIVGGPFWSRGGWVSVDYFDGHYLELSYSATFVENIPAEFHPRTALVQGAFARRVIGRAGLASVLPGMVTGSVNAYLCGRDETKTLDIDVRTPAANASNVAYINPELEITFTKPVDPNTVSRNVQLDYRAPTPPGGSRRENTPVAGTWEATPGDPHSVRFVPQAHLRDGIIYCVRVRAGAQGVRGRDGEVLEPDAEPPYPAESRAACSASRPWAESREWALSTRPELENLRVDLYQASLAKGDTRLVQAKPTVARVYAFWSPDPRVHEAAQVKWFPARVSVVADGAPAYAPKRVRVTRPDLFDAEDRRNARNSINFFDWRPSGSGPVDVKASVEFLDDRGSAVHVHESPPERVTRWDHTEILSLDYYFIPVKGECPNDERGCDWTEQIHPAWREKGRRLALEGAQFTTQTFPVIETQARPMGDLLFDEPLLSGPCGRLPLPRVGPASEPRPGAGPCEEIDTPERCYNPGLPVEDTVNFTVANALYEAGRDSYADIIVGFVPPGFASDWVGLMRSLDAPEKRVVLVDIEHANGADIAHEFGHFFQRRGLQAGWQPLDHCPDHPCEPTQCPEQHIQGFRVNPSGRSGFNKHEVEGNQETTTGSAGMASAPADPRATGVLVPLMHWRTHPVANVFISTANYLELFDRIRLAPRRNAAGPRWPWRSEPMADRLLLFANALRPVPLLAQRSDAGRFLVSGWFDGSEIRLTRVVHRPDEAPADTQAAAGEFTLDLLDGAGRVVHSTSFGATSPGEAHTVGGGRQVFFVEAPATDGVERVRVTAPGGVGVERARSRSGPTVRASLEPSTASVRTLRWTASDPDGDQVRVSVYLRAAGEGAWRGVAIDTTRTKLELDASRLPPGQMVTARLVGSDGFNSSVVDVDLGPGPSLTVLAVAPVDGAVDVALQSDVLAWVSAPLAAGDTGGLDRRLADRFRLTGPAGKQVLADVAYQPGTGVIVLAPAEPLQAGAQYTATLEGLEDRTGRRLASSLAWSFTTARATPRRTKVVAAEETGGPAEATQASASAAEGSPPDAPSDASRAPGECDCSCQAFEAFKRVQQTEDPAQQAALTRQFQCALRCASAWGSCPAVR